MSAAARDSSQAVLEALDQTMRVLAPRIDAVLAYVPEGDDLACVYAAGARAQHFAGSRLKREGSPALPARASLCGHHLELECGGLVIPTDRAALAIPMLAGDRIVAVVYAASAAAGRFADSAVLVRAVAQGAYAYALAAERETDRARATYDALTGLYTPRAFREKLQAELGRANPQKTALGLWFVDTDRFKRVNDTLGHATGDAVLVRMAMLLRAQLTTDVDLAARNGGDEFCAILRNAGKVTAIARAQRFCVAVRGCDFGVGFDLSASIGVAAFPFDAHSANELLEVADAAMYHSKRAGRNRVSFRLGGAFETFA